MLLTGNDDGVSRAVVDGTALVISFNRVAQSSGFDALLDEYLLGGKVIPLTVKVTKGKIDYEYTMVFSEGSLAGENGLAASNAISLVEYFDIEANAK